MGHYALFLDDNYLGVSDDGLLVAVEGCAGAMSDPYADNQSEFHPEAGWDSSNCKNTLSQYHTQRSDRETIETFYEWLNEPITPTLITQTNPGPNILPLGITRVVTASQNITQPEPLPEPLEVPVFYLTDQEDNVLPHAQARRDCSFNAAQRAIVRSIWGA